MQHTPQELGPRRAAPGSTSLRRATYDRGGRGRCRGHRHCLDHELVYSSWRNGQSRTHPAAAREDSVATDLVRVRQRNQGRQPAQQVQGNEHQAVGDAAMRPASTHRSVCARARALRRGRALVLGLLLLALALTNEPAQAIHNGVPIDSSLFRPPVQLLSPTTADGPSGSRESPVQDSQTILSSDCMTKVPSTSKQIRSKGATGPSSRHRSTGIQSAHQSSSTNARDSTDRPRLRFA
jgi:hypothetical protein